ncbi:MAG: aspartate--tRNA(Asn) ligase [Thermoplasmata archaeon]|uniref:Aspartate--tRNA ligase n=1 Tax=Candidatus Sysuiplasma superficiale TaxID=2823368 RepID=A0A8J7YTE3_9ARCH|nr:aspartate--tRNA(Asn) ligase [Candidatus Sysuiplasma superficiale]
MPAISTSDSVASMPEGSEVRISGWVEEIRDLGGISFYLVRDGYGYVQVTVSRKGAGAEIISALSDIQRESVIEVTGKVRRSEKARMGFELVPYDVKVLSKADAPLPMGVSDRVETEFDTRLDNRFIDLRKQENGAVYRIRSEFAYQLRSFLRELRFVEVSTPKIVSEGAEGGATLFRVDYFGRKAFLAQSPQLYKQILMASGLNRVYEISPAYRAELSDTVRHTSEFISFDAEMAFIDGLEDVLNVLEGLMARTFSATSGFLRETYPSMNVPPVPRTPFPRLSYTECLDMLSSEGRDLREGDDLDTDAEKAIGRIMKEKGYEMYFITMYPASIKPFYIMEKGDGMSFSFDLEYNGVEMASGGQREHRHERLVERMKSKNLRPGDFEFYLKAFRYGMPPHGGWGLGFDRLIASYLRLGNIREAILFPRDRSRLSP